MQLSLTPAVLKILLGEFHRTWHTAGEFGKTDWLNKWCVCVCMCVKYFVIWQPAIVPRESEKAGHPTLVYNFGKIMLTDFQNSFTVGLGSKRVIK